MCVIDVLFWLDYEMYPPRALLKRDAVIPHYCYYLSNETNQSSNKSVSEAVSQSSNKCMPSEAEIRSCNKLSLRSKRQAHPVMSPKRQVILVISPQSPKRETNPVISPKREANPVTTLYLNRQASQVIFLCPKQKANPVISLCPKRQTSPVIKL